MAEASIPKGERRADPGAPGRGRGQSKLATWPSSLAGVTPGRVRRLLKLAMLATSFGCIRVGSFFQRRGVPTSGEPIRSTFSVGLVKPRRLLEFAGWDGERIGGIFSFCGCDLCELLNAATGTSALRLI
jgi:hypothetical protein